MKRSKVGLGIELAILAVMVVIVAVVLWPRTFALSPEYVGRSGFAEVSTEELRELIEQKKSFALLIYQPACRASEDFEKVLEGFSEREQVEFEKISFSEVKNSGLVEGLKYYPSVALYHDGKLVDYLRTDEDEDIGAYLSEEGFAEWWGRHVRE